MRPASWKRLSSAGWLGALILGPLALVFARSLVGQFVFDDTAFLSADGLVQKAGAPLSYWIGLDSPDYFPFTLTLYWIQQHVFGVTPIGYHAVSIALHAWACVLVYRVLTLARFDASRDAAALFAVHPLQVATVAWIAEQRNSQSLILCLYAFLALARPGRAGPRRLFSLVCFALALVSKQAMVVFPALMLLLFWRMDGSLTRRRVMAIVPHAVLAALFAVFAVWTQQAIAIASEPLEIGPLAVRLGNIPRVIVENLRHLAAPVDLSMMYVRWNINHLEPASYIAWAIVVLVGIVVYSLPRKYRDVWAFGFGWYFIALCPTVGLVRLYYFKYAFVADHWQYVALIGPAAAAAETATLVAPALSAVRWLRIGVAAALIALTVLRQGLFANERVFWTDVLRTNPNSAAARNGLGSARMDEGAVDEALSLWTRALEIDPDFATAHRNLGAYYAGQKDWDRARLHYAALARLVVADLEARNNLGAVYVKLGDPIRAREQFAAAAVLAPTDALVHYNLAEACVLLKDLECAKREFSEALRLKPSWDAPLSRLHDLPRVGGL